MKIFEPRFFSGPVERSNAGGGGGDVTALEKTYEDILVEAEEIAADLATRMENETGNDRQRNLRWNEAYGVKVEYDFRRLLVRMAVSVATSKEKPFANSSLLFRTLENDKHYPVPKRSLQDWRDRGRHLGYFSVIDPETIGATSFSGRDTYIYFTGLQKRALMKATGAC